MVKNLHGSAFIQLEFLSFFFSFVFITVTRGVARNSIQSSLQLISDSSAIHLSSTLYLSIRREYTGRESNLKLYRQRARQEFSLYSFFGEGIMSKEVQEDIHQGCAAFRDVSRGRQWVLRLCYLLKCANFLGNV